MVKWFQCVYHYNRDMKFSYRYISRRDKTILVMDNNKKSLWLAEVLVFISSWFIFMCRLIIRARLDSIIKHRVWTLLMQSTINLTNWRSTKTGESVYVKKAPTEQGYSKASRTGEGVKQTYWSGAGAGVSIVDSVGRRQEGSPVGRWRGKAALSPTMGLLAFSLVYADPMSFTSGTRGWSRE